MNQRLTKTQKILEKNSFIWLLPGPPIFAGVSQWHEEIDKSVTGIVTFKYLRLFMSKHRRTLERRRGARLLHTSTNPPLAEH
jgi:hypothetical protein